MCGLALSFNETRLQYLLSKLKHRGPDSQSQIRAGSAILGHTRLSIVGLSDPTAEQPLVKAQSYAVAFNGELFNQQQLSTTQSEISILGELIQSRDDLGQLINGYYSVILVDISRNEIVLARDIFGIMPLYYSPPTSEFGFEVSSERRDLSDARPVPPGGYLIYNISTRKLKTQKFTFPFRLRAPLSPQRLTESFLEAVSRTASHSEVGFSLALSGGLDSSMLLAALKTLEIRPTAIITVFTQTQDASELDRARALCARFGYDSIHHVYPIDKTLDVRYWLDAAPNPIRDHAFLRHATIAKHCPSKVLLCGEGADELDLGYPVNKVIDTATKIYLKKISLLRSQSAMTLERVNKAGMIYSKEYRVPFLDLNFVCDILNGAYNPKVQKAQLKSVARELGVPEDIILASKYSLEERVGRESFYL